MKKVLLLATDLAMNRILPERTGTIPYLELL